MASPLAKRVVFWVCILPALHRPREQGTTFLVFTWASAISLFLPAVHVANKSATPQLWKYASLLQPATVNTQLVPIATIAMEIGIPIAACNSQRLVSSYSNHCHLPWKLKKKCDCILQNIVDLCMYCFSSLMEAFLDCHFMINAIQT